MALTRKLLKGMGLTEEQVDTIIEAHGETVSALKEEREAYKTDADKLPELRQKLEESEQKAQKNEGETVLKSKFEDLKKEYEQYKRDVAEREARATKEHAFRNILQKSGVSEKRIDAIIKVSEPEINGIEFDENGKIKDLDAISAAVKTNWADFIVSTEIRGADTPTPPENNPTTKDPFEQGFDGD